MNNIKNILLIVALLSSLSFYGQRKENHEKIKSLKIAFITEKLDLSSDEAQKFWPIYNEHEASKKDIRQKERSQIRSKIRASENLSEEEASDLLEAQIAIENEKSNLSMNYFKKLRAVIPAKKILLLVRSEEEFKRQLIKQYRHKRGGGGGYR